MNSTVYKANREAMPANRRTQSSDGHRDAAVVPALGVPSSVAAVRTLGRHGVDPIAVSSNPKPPAFYSKYCAEQVIVPSPRESMDAYADALLELAGRDRVKALLPMREADIYALAANRAAFARRVDPVWPPFETLRNVQDRLTLLSLAEDLGIPTPDSQLLTEWPDTTDRLVVKSRYTIVVDEDDPGANYPGVEVIPRGASPSLDDAVEEMGHVPLVQEFIPNGGEYGFFALYDHGEPVATFQHERVRSGAYTGGASVYRRAIDIPTLERYGLALLSELDWHGPAMVEFRRSRRDGTFRLMEVNPRFWGSLALPIRAGVDFPNLYFQLATGERPTQNGYRTGVGSHVLRGELGYLYTVLRGSEYEEPPPLGGELLDIAHSLAQQPHFDFLSVDDPVPLGADLRNLASDLFDYSPS
jgi:predicted ATP-grasp superfamily ATP-dependent carboligase